MNKHSNGFTVIEIMFVAIIIGLSSVIFFIQKHNIETVASDSQAKTAINSMYYGLEEVFYPTNKYYPQTITSDILKSVDPALFTDPAGNKINTAGSIYSYKPANCSNNKCKNYTLEAALNNEGDYAKTNRNN